MTILRQGFPIPSQLRRSTRRLDRRLAGVDRILGAMRKGEELHLHYENGRPTWSLSGGQVVSAEVAELLTNNASVAPIGGALFDDMPGQTWRFVP
jgi:hypothetical protein